LCINIAKAEIKNKTIRLNTIKSMATRMNMTIQHDIAWENWSGAQKSIPKSFIQPQNLEQLMDVVQSHPKIRWLAQGTHLALWQKPQIP
jgi:Xanthine dehydrogenase, iron-sulfur cluster and FAD-binding subunit A